MGKQKGNEFREEGVVVFGRGSEKMKELGEKRERIKGTRLRRGGG